MDNATCLLPPAEDDGSTYDPFEEYFRDRRGGMPFTVAIADDRSERSGREMDNDDQYILPSINGYRG